jgi:hypothetical protein
MKDGDLPAVLGEGLRHSLRIQLYTADEFWWILMCQVKNSHLPSYFRAN